MEDLAVGGWLILKSVLKKIGRVDMDCICVAQDKEKWQALVNIEMNLQVQHIYILHLKVLS